MTLYRCEQQQKEFMEPINFKSPNIDMLKKLHLTATEMFQAYQGGAAGLPTLIACGIFRFVSLAEAVQYLELMSLEEQLAGLRAAEAVLAAGSPEMVVCKALKLLALTKECMDYLDSVPKAQRIEILEAASYLFLNEDLCFNPACKLIDPRPDPIEKHVRALVARFMMVWSTLGVKEYSNKGEKVTRLIVDNWNFPSERIREWQDTELKANRYLEPKVLGRLLTANFICPGQYKVIGLPYNHSNNKRGTFLMSVTNGQMDIPKGFPYSLKNQKTFFEDGSFGFEVMLSFLRKAFYRGSQSYNRIAEKRIDEVWSKLAGVLHPLIRKRQRGAAYWCLYDPIKEKKVDEVAFRLFTPTD